MTLEESKDPDQDLCEPLLSSEGNETYQLPEQPAAQESAESQGDESWKDIALTIYCCCTNNKTLRVNHNVFFNLILALLYGVSNSLWNGTAYAAYLKQLGHNHNGPLGAIEAVSGLASLVTALPVGYLADKLGRSKVISVGGILLFCTSVLQIFVLEWSTDHNPETALWIMGVIMALWGIGDGIIQGPASALYADSTPEGQRSVYYTYLFATYMAASSVGPLVSIILFQKLGDDWDLCHLRIVIYVGLGVQIVNSFLMMLFDDEKALDESKGEDNTDSAGAPTEEESFVLEDENMTEEDQEEQPTKFCCSFNQKWIPYIIFFQGLILAIGSGMTVKFFPLFFKDEVGLSPSQVQLVYCAVPFVMVITSTLGFKLASSGFGRVQTTLVFSCLGISLLFCMVFFKQYLDSHPFTLVPIYVMRTSLMNASYPLTQSILMDFVPKEERARWKSLDSVAMFGWCGSAFLGGLVADRKDYTYTFLITAIIQTIGTVVWALLIPLVPPKEGEATCEGEVPDCEEEGLRDPLLSSNETLET